MNTEKTHRAARPLDEVDRQILRLLRDDGRRPNSEIARAVHISEPTVRKRLERLRECGVLRIIGLLDPVAVGYDVDVLIGVRVEHGVARTLGRRLAAMDCVAFVGYATGRYDLYVEAVFVDNRSLFAFIGETFGTTEGVIATETFHIMDTDKFVYVWDLPEDDAGTASSDARTLLDPAKNGVETAAAPLPEVIQEPPAPPSQSVWFSNSSAAHPGGGTPGPVELDHLDRSVLRLLADDGRRSTAEMARTLGVSEPTVRKHLERLREAGVLRIMGLLDPAATGYPVYAVICVQCRPGAIREVGRRFAALDRVAMVQYTTGRFDIFVEAMLESNKALYEFLGGDVAAIDGILSTETFHVLAVDKFNYMWALPDDGAEAT